MKNVGIKSYGKFGEVRRGSGRRGEEIICLIIIRKKKIII